MQFAGALDDLTEFLRANDVIVGAAREGIARYVTPAGQVPHRAVADILALGPPASAANTRDETQSTPWLYPDGTPWLYPDGTPWLFPS